MTTYIPKPGEWKILGTINNNLTWLAIKPQAKVLKFEEHLHLETYYFEKGARISFTSGENGQDLHVEPSKALTKRTAVA